MSRAGSDPQHVQDKVAGSPWRGDTPVCGVSTGTGASTGTDSSSGTATGASLGTGSTGTGGFLKRSFEYVCGSAKHDGGHKEGIGRSPKVKSPNPLTSFRSFVSGKGRSVDSDPGVCDMPAGSTGGSARVHAPPGASSPAFIKTGLMPAGAAGSSGQQYSNASSKDQYNATIKDQYGNAIAKDQYATSKDQYGNTISNVSSKDQCNNASGEDQCSNASSNNQFNTSNEQLSNVSTADQSSNATSNAEGQYRPFTEDEALRDGNGAEAISCPDGDTPDCAGVTTLPVTPAVTPAVTPVCSSADGCLDCAHGAVNDCSAGLKSSTGYTSRTTGYNDGAVRPSGYSPTQSTSTANIQYTHTIINTVYTEADMGNRIHARISTDRRSATHMPGYNDSTSTPTTHMSSYTTTTTTSMPAHSHTDTTTTQMPVYCQSDSDLPHTSSITVTTDPSNLSVTRDTEAVTPTADPKSVLKRPSSGPSGVKVKKQVTIEETAQVHVLTGGEGEKTGDDPQQYPKQVELGGDDPSYPLEGGQYPGEAGLGGTHPQYYGPALQSDTDTQYSHHDISDKATIGTSEYTHPDMKPSRLTGDSFLDSVDKFQICEDLDVKSKPTITVSRTDSEESKPGDITGNNCHCIHGIVLLTNPFSAGSDFRRQF